MQISVEKTDNKLERKLHIQVPAERVEEEVTGRLKMLGKRARLKGFRPGKAPLKVLEQQFGPQVRQEVLNDLIQQTFSEALKRENLTPAGNPRIDATQTQPGAAFEYTATVELYPELELKPIDSLTIERPEVAITDADVDKMVGKLRDQRATWEAVERAAADGDQLTIDFEGKLDGEVFPGGTGKQVPVVLGSGRFVDGFERNLIGAKAGDVREFDLEFPSDYPNQQLAGKKAQFAVTVHAVAERRLPEMDDAFFEVFGVANLDELKDGVRENMQRELDQVVHRRVKDQVLEQLVEAHPDVELPVGLVNDEINRLRSEALQRMGGAQSKKAPNLPGELFEDAARRRVKTGLLLQEVVRRESIKLDRERVRARIDDIAAGFDEPQKVLEAYAQNPRLVAGVEALVIEDQAVEMMAGRAKTNAKPMSFDEIMNPESEDDSK